MAQVSQSTQPAKAPSLGWGIIGSADGYQSSVQGLAQQINMASHFDLLSDIAVVLPAADMKDRIPLYYVSRFNENNQQFNGIAQYFSVKQKGSHRSGTFLGSFLVTPYSWGVNSFQSIQQALLKLSVFQFKNFIEEQSNSYKNDIKNVPFESPSDELRTIASSLQNPLNPLLVSNNGILFIDCSQQAKSDLFALEFILSNGLNRIYEHIYFSCSPTIAEKFRKLDAVCLTLDQIKKAKSLFNLFGQTILTERDYRQKAIQSMQQANREREQLQAHFNQQLDAKVQQEKRNLEQRYAQEFALVKQSNENLQSAVKKAEKIAQDHVAQAAIMQKLYAAFKEAEQQTDIQQETLVKQDYANQIEQLKRKANQAIESNNRLKQEYEQKCTQLAMNQQAESRSVFIAWGVAALIALFSCGWATYSYFTDDSKDQITSLEKKKKDLEKSLSEKEEAFNNLQAQHQKLQQEREKNTKNEVPEPNEKNKSKKGDK